MRYGNFFFFKKNVILNLFKYYMVKNEHEINFYKKEKRNLPCWLFDMQSSYDYNDPRDVLDIHISGGQLVSQRVFLARLKSVSVALLASPARLQGKLRYKRMNTEKLVARYRASADDEE